MVIQSLLDGDDHRENRVVGTRSHLLCPVIRCCHTDTDVDAPNTSGTSAPDFAARYWGATISTIAQGPQNFFLKSSVGIGHKLTISAHCTTEIENTTQNP